MQQTSLDERGSYFLHQHPVLGLTFLWGVAI